MLGAAPQTVTDFQSFTTMRAEARSGENREQNLDRVAQQFESLFIGMMLKQMRQANDSMGGSLLDSKQSQHYRDMYDQQISLHLAERGGLGLAPAIKRQLGGQAPVSVRERSQADYLAHPTPLAQGVDSSRPLQSEAAADSDTESFVRRLRPHAEAAARQLGLPAEALIAQAALETGWGRSVMAGADGGSSHNLFGIKADARWDGGKVSVDTLEYRDGVAMKIRADFRSYDSYADSFADYVDFIASQPRYSRAMQAGEPRAYFDALQQAGYATDPAYADKILNILQRPEMRALDVAAARGNGRG